jgi:tetratricopeptide (TPR) repeat protein
MIGNLQARARRRLGLMPGAGSRGWLVLVGAGATLGASAAAAQSLPVVSHPVVQPLPSEGGASTSNDPARQLSNALARLGRDPRDADALADAGNAAMVLGDENAAESFYARADRIAPGNPKVAAAWATAKMHANDPVGAIPLYDQAAQHGVLTSDQSADRGLAHDLVGDNANAQRFYHEALAGGENDEALRRLALSQAIAGDRKAMEATLAPLLQQQDRAAWRTRAFAFAILGREDEAVAIARSTMPTELANGMAPFLRFMRKLTPAQQAAAANLGRFPRAADIGKDDPRILAYATQHGVKRLAMADAPLVPAGEPLGGVAPAAPRREDGKAGRRRGAAEQEAVGRPAPSLPSSNPLPPDPNPSREVSPPPALASAANPPPRRVPPAEPEVRATPPAPQQPSPTFAAAQDKPRATSGFDLARLPAGETPAPARPGPVVAEAPRSQPVPPEPRVAAAPPPPSPVAPHPTRAAGRASARAPLGKASFAEAFSAWGAPEKAGVASEAPASGAVDLRKIKPRRPAPKAPPPPPNPSRVWVQVGVGRSADRIAFDWRRMTRENPKLLAGRKAWTSDWGRTNRVLVGPFDDEDEAKAFVTKAKKAGLDDAFMWLSPDGQAVDALDK